MGFLHRFCSLLQNQGFTKLQTPDKFCTKRENSAHKILYFPHGREPTEKVLLTGLRLSAAYFMTTCPTLQHLNKCIYLWYFVSLWGGRRLLGLEEGAVEGKQAESSCQHLRPSCRSVEPGCPRQGMLPQPGPCPHHSEVAGGEWIELGLFGCCSEDAERFMS